MKTILRAIFLNMVVLYLSTRIYGGLSYDGTLKTLVVATIALTLLNRIVKPIIKLLLLPINLITLGIFSWVAHVATLFILTRLVHGFVVRAYYFPGFTYQGFIAPPMQISVITSYIIASLTISLTASVVGWLVRK
jgi:putative membrane protein